MHATLTIHEDEMRNIIVNHISGKLGKFAADCSIDVKTELYPVRVILKDYPERMRDQRAERVRQIALANADNQAAAIIEKLTTTPEAEEPPEDYVPPTPAAAPNDSDPF